jgi:CheY-like chemotaxis protein
VIILDLIMPEMDGYEFREEQKKDPALAAIPVIVVTAAGGPSPVDAAKVMRKPPIDLEIFAGGASTSRGQGDPAGRRRLQRHPARAVELARLTTAVAPDRPCALGVGHGVMADSDERKGSGPPFHPACDCELRVSELKADGGGVLPAHRRPLPEGGGACRDAIDRIRRSLEGSPPLRPCSTEGPCDLSWPWATRGRLIAPHASMLASTLLSSARRAGGRSAGGAWAA